MNMPLRDPRDSPTILEVRKLVAGYGKSTVLDEVDLEVRDECVALIGPNGAGKTTLAECLTGVMVPRGGQVLIRGEDVTRKPPREFGRKGVVLCPEGRQLFPRMTVRDNLLLGFPSWRKDRAERDVRLSRVMDLFPEVQRLQTRNAGLLSGGEQQMVAVGRALMAGPDLLVLDEPSLGLAPLLVERLFRIVEEIRAAGCAVLLSEQNVVATLEIADRAYVLEAGRVVSHGTVAEIRAHPRVAEAFLGTT